MAIKFHMIFGLQENVSLPVVFIDGITRCGKSAFSGIIPSLTRMEHIQFSTELELIMSGLALNGLSIEYAKAFVRIYLNERSYNLHLSRNVNFRPTDQTGIHNFRNPEIYIKRLDVQEGADVLGSCRLSNNYLPFQTHDFLANLKKLEALEIDYRMLSLWRHPVDTIYSWWTRGWGERYNGDPSGFTLLVRGETELYPWYAAAYSNELSELNPMEKCIRIATDLLDRAANSYKFTDDKTKIHVFKFEEFCVNSDYELKKICHFLNVEYTEKTPESLKLARFPRDIDPDSRVKKLQIFETTVRRKYLDQLLDFSDRYETDCYGLLSIN